MKRNLLSIHIVIYICLNVFYCMLKKHLVKFKETKNLLRINYLKLKSDREQNGNETRREKKEVKKLRVKKIP